jgi:sterol desaturase/sphingolipid hydroxylase (fatty acid hydroxylase superfamily)
MSYDWLAALVFVALFAALMTAGKLLAFRVPALQRMRELNAEADRRKLADEAFRRDVRFNNAVAVSTNLVLFAGLMPFCLTLAAMPWWRHAADVFAVLVIYDFLYYLTHRFVFHGKPLLRVHARHHRARTPTYVDALYVHPLETAIGLVLFYGSIPIWATLTGGALSAYSMAVAAAIFSGANQINHTYVNLPYFPFKTLDYVTSVHAAHHVDMKRGNYATLTTVFDKMFGTFEQPVSREEA